jgi:hypothetical protein
VSLAEAGPSPPARAKQYRVGYVALLGIIFVCCAAAIFSYFATYPLLLGAARGIVQTGFWLFTISAPVFFGLAFFLRSEDLVAAAKVHASLYAAYTLVLACKLGHTNLDFISLLFLILLVEMTMLAVVVERAPEAARQLTGAPKLFSSLTVALLAGSACGALAWQLAVRAEIVDVAPAKWRDLDRHSSENGARNPVMRLTG